MIAARADKHLWAKSFERNSSDVLALQDELASAIAGKIHVQLTPVEQSRLTIAPTVNPARNPNYAFAHDQFGLALSFEGRLDEAVEEGKRASELDPLSPQIPIDNLLALAWQGKYQAAMEQARKAADLDPTFFFAQWGYGWIDIQAGKIRDAIPAFQKAKAMESPAFVSAFLGYAYGASGDRAHAIAELEDLNKTSLNGHVLPFNLALVYLGLGDRKRALDYLEQAYASDSQWMGWLKEDRIFDPLRSEPRFVALMRKLHFDK